jgi:2-polyprenyl-3-methyl-5-hydroxy-6-metoxy-1,4-benzoquinol methylase
LANNKNNHNIEFYNSNSKNLRSQYLSVSFEEIHASWLSFAPTSVGKKALDIGAASGRDALALHNLKYSVTAIEPAESLRKLGKKYTGDQVNWLDDTLPTLSSISACKYGLVLISAVWMHLSQKQQHASLTRLKEIVDKNGLLVITLRYGNFNDSRTTLFIDSDDTKKHAELNGFECVLEHDQSDQLVRNDVNWKTLVFKRSIK